MKFWQELRRRRVYRMAGLYIVGAWVVIQVAEVSFEAWGVPDTALRYLFIAALLCFPIAVIFSWFYDITSKGIIRTKPAEATEKVELRLQRADYGVLAALLAVSLAILFGSVGKIQQEIETVPEPEVATARRDNSIAVLPFTNLDPNPDTGYFSDGVTEEILSRLSNLRTLHVLGKVSSFAFRNSEEGPASISEKLGVRYLLQGSVRRDNDYVRITANLLDQEGFQVWSQSYDRKLESIFIIQAEIASSVSSEVINKIVPMQQLPAGRTTSSTEAYTAYLLGKSFFDTRGKDWLIKAETAYKKAIELDESFAPPYAGLAITTYFSELDPTAEEESLALAQKALQLDPELPFGLSVLGFIQGVVRGDEQGIVTLRHAVELEPNLTIAYNWLAFSLRAQGLPDEANNIHRKGLEIDPLNPILIANVADIESHEGDFERAEQLLLRLTKLPEPPRFTHSHFMDMYSKWGRYDKAAVAAREHARQNDDIGMLAYSYACLGMVDETSHWYEQARSEYPKDRQPLAEIYLTYYIAQRLGDNSQLVADLDYLDEHRVLETEILEGYVLETAGMAYIQAGRYQKGIDLLEQARDQDRPADQADTRQQGFRIARMSREIPPEFVINPAHRLVFAYQKSGRADNASTLLQEIDDVYWDDGMPEKGEPKMFELFALQRALSGDDEDALRALQRAADLGWAGYYEIANDPVWAETLEAPGFQALLIDLKEANDQQRAAVEAIEAEHDFRAEVAALGGR